MDIFDYASELLKQNGELKVPGLGYFVHIRKSSYYDQETGSVYPPYYETNFEQYNNDDEDDTLARYFAGKKNISLASAQYFLEKFVDKLKLQSETEEVDFSDLGTFYIDHQSQLAFSPNSLEMSYSSSLFGYGPVSLQKLKDIGQPVKPRPVIVQAERSKPTPFVKERLNEEGPVLVTAAQGAPITGIYESSTAQQPPEAEDYIPDENEPEKESLGFVNNLRYWIIIAVIVVGSLSGLIFWYKHKTVVPEKPVAVRTVKPEVAEPPAVVKTDTAGKNDTVKTNGQINGGIKTDSAAKAIAQPAPTTPVNNSPAPSVPVPVTPSGDVPKNTWIIAGGQYANFPRAKATMLHFRSMGYTTARLLDSIPKKEYFIYKIIFGFHQTKQDAIAHRRDLLKIRKLKPKFITVQLYK